MRGVLPEAIAASSCLIYAARGARMLADPLRPIRNAESALKEKRRGFVFQPIAPRRLLLREFARINLSVTSKPALGRAFSPFVASGALQVCW